MKLAIVSDIHANLEALRATLDSVAGDQVDRIVCLGDIVGYNADPAPCIAALRDRAAVCVAGNHDRAVAGLLAMDGFSAMGANAVRWTATQLDRGALDFLARLPLTRCIGDSLVAVHGALHPRTGQDVVRLDTPERMVMTAEALLAHPSGARLCAFGHTHQLGIYEYRDGVLSHCDADTVTLRPDAVYLVNPGTVGQPRYTERRATYVLFDTTCRALSVRRVAYDHETAFRKSLAAGLVPKPVPLPEPVKAALRQGARALGVYRYLRPLR